MTAEPEQVDKNMSSVSRTISDDELKARIVDFVGRASTEVTPHDEGLLAQLPQYLPPAASIYVAHPPRTEFRDVMRLAAQLVRLGFAPCPHVAAREVHSEASLRAALNEMRDSGVTQILLIAGDRKDPAGPFTSAVEILESGITVDAAIKTIGVAGHPEGNSTIGAPRLKEALLAKQAFADRTGTDVRLVTQFGFNPQAMLDWANELVQQGIRMPIHLGVAGPTPLPKLIRFAMRCGIGASLSALMRNPSKLTSMTGMATTPDEMVTGIIRAVLSDPASRIVKPHFYCFGGLIETAGWIRAVSEGAFDLQAKAGPFALRH
jgi:methylenetetrahydrofolate reductase (NADPH)